MEKKKGLFVGLCLLDVVFYHDRPLPKEDAKIKIEDVRAHVGGPAANAAITYALLGGESVVVSFLGNSSIAKILKEMMAELGIRVVDLCEDDEAKCISSVYVNTADSTRTILSGRKAPERLKSLDLLEKEIDESDFILYDAHFEQIEDKLFQTAKRGNKEIVIDVGSWIDTFERILKYDPILICSEVFEKEGKNGLELMEEYGYRRAAITRGGKSILYRDAENRGEIAVRSVHAVDTLGAGDVFHGAFCHAFFQNGCDFASALCQASLVASISTTVYGVIEGVKEYLKLQKKF